MRQVERVASTGVTRCKHSVPFAFHLCWIELEVHKLVHVPTHYHVTIQKDSSLILNQRENGQLAPRCIEPWIAAEVSMFRRLQEVDMFLGNIAIIKRFVTFRRKAIGVKCNKWISGFGKLQRVIQAKQTSQVLGVGDERSPDWSHGGFEYGDTVILLFNL